MFVFWRRCWVLTLKRFLCQLVLWKLKKKISTDLLLNIMTFCSLGFSSCCSSNRGRKRLKQNYRGGRRSTALHGFWTKTAGTLRTQQLGSAGTWCQHSPRLSAVLVFVLATCPSVWSRDGQTDRQTETFTLWQTAEEEEQPLSSGQTDVMVTHVNMESD